MSAARPRLLGLQYLRAVAALGVVLFHASRATVGGRIGEAGVDLFFALSGFLMVTITSETSRPLAFLADRAKRIVPLYWFATTVMLAGAIAHLFPRVKLTVWHIVSSYAFLPAWSPSSGELHPLLVPGWTLQYEMMFYLVFASLLLLRNAVKALAVLTLVFGAAVAIGPSLPRTSAAAVAYTDPIILEFVAGGWLGLAWKRGLVWPGWLGWPAILLGAALLWLFRDLPQGESRVLHFGTPTLLLLFGVLTLERARPIARWRLPLLLGNASYSIYLWHTLAISVVLKAAGRIDLGNSAAIALAFALGTAIGVASYRLIEEPILAFFHRRRTVRGIPVPAGP